MNSDTSTLPDDPAALKQIILDLQNKQQKEHDALYKQIDLLQEELRRVYAELFGPKSEVFKGQSPQLPLFDMPEPDPDSEPTPEEVVVAPHSRKKTGRKPLPDSLPRIEVVHDIEEVEKVCGCGAELNRIGEEVSEKLDLIPAIIRVIRHIRPKYSCKSCDGVDDEGATVKVAPVPPQIIPKGIASGGLLAHILTAKFEDALPFYRQQKQFTRLGVDLGRATMCNWAMKVAEHCQPLINLLHSEILSGPLINVDETTVQVLEEPGRSPTTKSYMWVFRGGPTDSSNVLYQYHPSRAGDVAHTFLRDYNGAVQTDGYSGYNFLDSKSTVVHVGCWAHARRKFMEAEKARPKNAKPGSSTVALKYIQTLYGVEKKGKRLNISGRELVLLREKEALPTLLKFRKWLEKKSLAVTPKSLLGKAVSYTLKQWQRLTAYIHLADVSPDNNSAENAIRPFVVGRKNWLFAGTPDGARASAAMYTLIETAKANNLDVYRYLRFLFEKLPFAKTEEEYRNLLPSKLNPEQIALPLALSVV